MRTRIHGRGLPGTTALRLVFITVPLGLCVLALILGCGRNERSDTDLQPKPILLLGVDGLEWDVLLPMLQNGRLPNFSRIMKQGYSGELKTLIPTFSPVIWTTIATGKGPKKHGINHFVRRLPGGGLSLFNNFDRKTKAIWNVLTDHGKTVAVIGWWMTHPVEEINGVMVAQTNTMDQIDTRAGQHVWKGTLLKGVDGQVHPPDRQNEMMTILENVDGRLPGLTKEIFGEFQYPLSALGERLWDNCQWAFRADATYLQIALQLTESGALPDLTLLYLGGPDVVGHRFWRFMRPALYQHRPGDEQLRNFGNVIEDYYAYVDESLGRLLDAYGSEGTVVVISDHGMRAVNLRASFDPDDPPADINSADHRDAPPGVFIASGPGIRASHQNRKPQSLTRHDLESAGTVLDVTPTLLSMMGIPVGEDMDGGVMTRVFDEDFVVRHPEKRIPSHDTIGFTGRRGRSAPTRPEAERLEQLRRLGYIDNDEEEDR